MTLSFCQLVTYHVFAETTQAPRSLQFLSAICPASDSFVVNCVLTCDELTGSRCSATWIYICGPMADVVIYSKFHQNSLRAFVITGGSCICAVTNSYSLLEGLVLTARHSVRALLRLNWPCSGRNKHQPNYTKIKIHSTYLSHETRVSRFIGGRR